LLETLVNQTLSETAVPVKDWPQDIGFSAIFSNKAVDRRPTATKMSQILPSHDQAGLTVSPVAPTIVRWAECA
jgi:hypothetical protein